MVILKQITRFIEGEFTSHKGPLTIHRRCKVTIKVMDGEGKLLFETEQEEAAERFVSWYNLGHSAIIR